MSIRTTLLERILEPDGIAVVFQPIYSLRSDTPRLYALEGLVRGPLGTNMESADVLFEYVRRKREESLVDRVCVSRVLQAAREFPGSPRISLNVHASTLGRDPEFVSFLGDQAAAAQMSPTRLTVEIVEHSPFWDGPSFFRAVSGLRELGVRIALDDVGLGQSNYRMMLDSHPDYLKVDRYVVDGSSTDYFRQCILRSISDLARAFYAQAVAEGLDNVADLNAVIDAGFDLVQGFLLCQPANAATLTRIGALNGAVNQLSEAS
jgi:EAL domain-containing protein (putative c-di-GMP-specific phosphodiesterase class I)